MLFILTSVSNNTNICYIRGMDKFINNIKPNPDTRCWEWQGAKRNKAGYGAFSLKGKVIDAHRFSYEYYKGEIPEGLFILHSCDNPSCVNPDHLRAGTARENVRDSIERGTHNFLKPTRTSLKKGHKMSRVLSDEAVAEIRRLISIGKRNVDIIDMMGISKKQVSDIRRGRTYKD